MCSTPSPKRRINSKQANGGASILSSISTEKRQSFAERANQASERRIEAVKLKQEAQKRVNKLRGVSISHTHKKTKTNINQFWSFISKFKKLLNAPLNELMRKLVA